MAKKCFLKYPSKSFLNLLLSIDSILSYIAIKTEKHMKKSALCVSDDKPRFPSSFSLSCVWLSTNWPQQKTPSLCRTQILFFYYVLSVDKLFQLFDYQVWCY